MARPDVVLDAQIGLAFQPRAQNIGHQRGDFQRLVRAGVNRLRIPDDFPAPVDAVQELAAHPRGDDVHHVDLRAEVGDDALDGRKAAREHRQAARHGNAVALHHVGQILKDLRQIHAAQIGRTVLIQQPLDVAVELALVRLAAKFAQPQHRVAAEADVAARHAADGLPDELALPLGQRAHHAHIQPDDFAVAHAQVAGVRIGVEKAVLHDLPNVVIRQLCADFRRVVAARQQRLAVVDGDAVDALHHQHVRRGPFAVEHRGGDERHVRVEGAEALKVGRLGQKIHFLLRDDPHLIQHLIEVQVHALALQCRIALGTPGTGNDQHALGNGFPVQELEVSDRGISAEVQNGGGRRGKADLALDRDQLFQHSGAPHPGKGDQFLLYPAIRKGRDDIGFDLRMHRYHQPIRPPHLDAAWVDGAAVQIFGLAFHLYGPCREDELRQIQQLGKGELLLGLAQPRPLLALIIHGTAQISFQCQPPGGQLLLQHHRLCEALDDALHRRQIVRDQ